MPFPFRLDWIPQVHCFTHWHCHGCQKDCCHYQVACPKESLQCPVILGLCQFLSEIYCYIFGHHSATHTINQEGYTIHLGDKTSRCLWSTKNCILTGPCPHPFQPKQPNHCWNGHLWLCDSCNPLPNHPFQWQYPPYSLLFMYEIYDKELLAIFGVFKQWWNYLEGATHTILVLSDHKNLEYFATTKQLSWRQVHWSEYLSGFNYIICYHARWLSTKPDALTHQGDMYLKGGDGTYALANPHNFQSMFKAGQLICAIILDSISLLTSIQQGQLTDPPSSSHISHLQMNNQANIPWNMKPDPWTLGEDGKTLLYKQWTYVCPQPQWYLPRHTLLTTWSSVSRPPRHQQNNEKYSKTVPLAEHVYFHNQLHQVLL